MARVYRNVSTPLFLFGLELNDLLGLAVLFILVFNFSEHIIFNLVILITATFGLKILKQGKPMGYTLHLLKFLLGPARRTVKFEENHTPYLKRTP